MKNGLIFAGVILLAGLLYFAVIGLQHTFSPRPVPVVTHTTDTLRLSQQQLDSADAVWRKRVYLVKHGTTVSRGRDTVTITVNDTTEAQGLYSLIDALTREQNAHQCPVVVAQEQPQDRGYKLGAAFGFGTALNKHSTEIKLGPALGNERSVISLSAKYHHWEVNDKWRGQLDYIRWFK